MEDKPASVIPALWSPALWLSAWSPDAGLRSGFSQTGYYMITVARDEGGQGFGWVEHDKYKLVYLFGVKITEGT